MELPSTKRYSTSQKYITNQKLRHQLAFGISNTHTLAIARLPRSARSLNTS